MLGIKSANREHIVQRINQIEKEIRETPYHKGTEHHIGLLRARLAILRQKLEDQATKKPGHGVKSTFLVRKQGDGSCLLLGPPSVGKSTLLNHLTNTQSQIGNYAFTTKRVIPGMLFYRNAKIQLLDAPGLLPDGPLHYGQGRQILTAIRGSDLLILVFDPQTYSRLADILRKLTAVGVRLNEEKPPLKIFSHRGNEIIIEGNLQPQKARMLTQISKELGLRGKRIVISKPLTVNQYLDALLSNRVFLPAILVINKQDLLTVKQKEKIRRFVWQFNLDPVFVSAQQNKGLKCLKKVIWRKLKLIKITVISKHTGRKKIIIGRQGEAVKILLPFSNLPQFKKLYLIKNGQRQEISWEYCPRGGEVFLLV